MAIASVPVEESEQGSAGKVTAEHIFRSSVSAVRNLFEMKRVTDAPRIPGWLASEARLPSAWLCQQRGGGAPEKASLPSVVAAHPELFAAMSWQPIPTRGRPSTRRPDLKGHADLTSHYHFLLDLHLLAVRKLASNASISLS